VKEIYIQCIAPDEELLLKPAETAKKDEFSVKDDGRGNIDVRIGTQQVGWFNLASGYLICDPNQVVRMDKTAGTGLPKPIPK